MPSTTSYEFGDVVLVPFPFTDQTTSKQRPAVVVSSTGYNRERRDVILLAITGQIRSPAALGEALISQWKEAGLLKPSVLKPVVSTVQKTLIRRTLGHLEPQDLQKPRGVLAEIVGGADDRG